MTDSETLQSAAWLLEREFAAEVRVLAAAEAPDDVASRAEPGRPAIDIHSDCCNCLPVRPHDGVRSIR